MSATAPPETGGPPIKLLAPQTKPLSSAVRMEHQWFVVCTSRELGARTLIARTLQGTPLVIFRTAKGTPAALLDRCAHRNVPLSEGAVRSGHVQCGYHGWEFDGTGRCQKVPGLCEPLDAERGRRVPSYACREQDGFVWAYTTPDTEPVREPFALPAPGPGYARVVRHVRAPGTLHATIENALDVPHTSFLHSGLFRTEEKRNRIDAIVRRSGSAATVEYVGEPRPSGLVGRALSPSGALVVHHDRFFLPSIAQVEYRIGTENHILVTACCTPHSDFDTSLYAVIHYRLRVWNWLARPLLEVIGRRIFAQDAHMLARQTEMIRRFGGERFESTEIDLLSAHIARLLRRAERDPMDPVLESDAIEHERTVTMMT